jgi:hypothetical protein
MEGDLFTGNCKKNEYKFGDLPATNLFMLVRCMPRRYGGV